MSSAVSASPNTKSSLSCVLSFSFPSSSFQGSVRIPPKVHSNWYQLLFTATLAASNRYTNECLYQFLHLGLLFDLCGGIVRRREGVKLDLEILSAVRGHNPALRKPALKGA